MRLSLQLYIVLMSIVFNVRRKAIQKKKLTTIQCETSLLLRCLLIFGFVKRAIIHSKNFIGHFAL